MNKTTNFAARYQGWTSRHSIVILLMVAAATVLGGYLASRLKLKTAFSELLPSDDPGVLTLNRTQERIGDMTLLLVGIRSPDRQANERYAAMLTEKLLALPNGMCKLASYHLRDLTDFFSKNRWLYLDEEQLDSFHDRLRSEITKRKNPLLVSLDDDEESLDDLRARVQKKDTLSEKFPNGLFTDKDGQYLWIAALPSGGLFVEHAGEDLWKAARTLVAQNPPEQFHPAMTAYVGGPIATAILNREAVERDILSVTITCLSIVALSIVLYFRSFRALFLVGMPGIVGTVVAFAFAKLTFGYLNSSTAFLGSIIIGNGINYAIVFLSRYEEHRVKGEPVGEALTHSIAGVWRATGSAAFAASAAYASLMITQFRGFYQFGVMGAIGAIGCWIATFTILPTVLNLIDHRRPEQIKRLPFRLSLLGVSMTKAPKALMLVFTAMTILALFGTSHFMKDPFEYDFRKLRISTKSTPQVEQFGDSLDKLFGRWPSPTIMLADEVGETEAMRQALRRQDSELNPGTDERVVGDIVTIDNILPGTAAVQERKLAVLAKMRKMLRDPVLETLKPDKRAELMKLDPPDTLRVLTPKDLPPLIRRPFTEVDGTVGRVMLVYPPDRAYSVWDGRKLLHTAKIQQEIRLPNKVIETSGSAVVFGAMIRSVLRDGPIATAASLTVILCIAFLMVRPVAMSLLALGTLLLGVLWMIGAAGLARVHVTFLNFIALPITFGIGIEYAINLVTRYRENSSAGTSKVDAVLAAVSSTGSAVALCSWTTIVGYGSLLAASNRALQGFGAMAILGEIACLGAAIFVLPTFIVWRYRRKT